jgi:hypothetical protein
MFLGIAHQHADPPHALGLLRACGNRPRRCTAEQRDELPPLNSIRSGGLQFSLGQKRRMIALHKSQQPVATTSSFFIRLFRELVGSSS